MTHLYIVGIGPGDPRHMTAEARTALAEAEVVVGYGTYLAQIESLLAGKEVVSTGMTKEVDRCVEALRIAAAGRTVALVSGGDAGIYGMAGLVLELAEQDVVTQSLRDVEISIVPGVSAVQAAAAVLGAPLMHDFAVISLSDLLTPWVIIQSRLQAAAIADFVVVLYNPRSRGRVRHLEEARSIMCASRPRDTPVGIVRNACRAGEERFVTTLEEMSAIPVDMATIVFIGNSATFVDRSGRMVTPRGYPVGAGTGRYGRGATPPFPEPSVAASAGKTLMLCGTASDVGKSVLTAAFCRILKRRGISVAPFKSQNMALNAAVTPEGGEIGRAQAVQAAACGIPPHTDMNPILLKPTSETGSQVIVQGKVVRTMSVGEYNDFKPEGFVRVRESFDRLRARFGFIVIEGAGSIAEINLKAHDIANLKVASMAGAPVILVADIDRGGVFAQIVGTLELLEPAERFLIKGVIINKFRGDATLLAPGIEFVERRTGIPVLGVVPYCTDFRIPAEDSVALDRRLQNIGDCAAAERLRIGVVRLPRIANFTDFEPLDTEPDVVLSYLEHPGEMAGLDLLIIPGSKATLADLAFLREQGFCAALREFSGPVMGICGGYQMLGKRVADPHGVESEIREQEGLGLLDVVTVLLPRKETHEVSAFLQPAAFHVAPRCAEELSGYEIHMGETILGPAARPFARITRRSGMDVEVLDGAVTADGRVFGTYLHGIFDNPVFCHAFLNRLRQERGLPLAEFRSATDPYELLADVVERSIDLELTFQLCGIKG